MESESSDLASQERIVLPEQKQVEHEGLEKPLRVSEGHLAVSDQILQAILQHTHMMAVLLDPQFNFVWVNRAYAATCRMAAEDFPGKNHFALYPHAENQIIFQKVVDTGEPFFVEAKSFEFPDQPERGVTYWDWSLIPVKDDAGNVTGLVFTLAEVTDRVKAQIALRESGERLRLFIEHAPAALAMFDRKMRYIAVSRRWIMDYGLAGREIIGQSHYAIFPEIPDRWRAVHRRGLDGEVIEAVEDRFVRADGAIQWLHWVVRPWHKDGGEVGGIVIFTEDITERKHMEAERMEWERQHQQLIKAESLNRMAGAIAHHFNNMLGAVIGNLELSMDDAPREGNLRSNLTEAMWAARKASDISGLMLTYLGLSLVDTEPIDLAEVCRQILPVLRRSMPRSIELRADLPPTGPVVKANSGQIRQVLENLVVNAAEAVGDRPGVVTLSLKTAAAESIPEAHRQPLDWQPRFDRYACMAVADTGAGIAPEDVEQIFDPFFSSKFIGRGLGLPVVLGIVREHGGVITVSSQPANGSRFQIFLPLTGAGSPPPAGQ